MANLEDWKDRLYLMDEDILTQEYLNRVAAQPPAQESEIIYCACGCGEFWLRPIDQKGGRRFIRGHSPPRETRKRIMRPVKKEEIIAVYHALRVREWTVTEKIAEKMDLSKDRCEMILRLIQDILSRPRLEVVKVGRMTAYRKEGS